MVVRPTRKQLSPSSAESNPLELIDDRHVTVWHDIGIISAVIVLMVVTNMAGWLQTNPQNERDRALSTAAAHFARGETSLVPATSIAPGDPAGRSGGAESTRLVR